MFTSGGVDVCSHLFVDHCCVNVFICMLNFRVFGLNREIILTAKFFQSTIFRQKKENTQKMRLGGIL